MSRSGFCACGNILDACNECEGVEKMKLPEIRKKKKKEGYDYFEDMNWDGCKHEKAKPFEIKSEWQQDMVSIIMECPDCTRIGIVNGEVKYYDGEVEWYDE